MSKGMQIAVAVLTVLAGLAWLIQAGGAGEGTFAYYESVAAFADKAPSTSERGLRVHGFVVEGSILKNLKGGHVDFSIQDAETAGNGALEVRLTNLDVPDLFKDGAEVVVEGHFSQGRFLAQRVMAKCPSKYEAAELGSEA